MAKSKVNEKIIDIIKEKYNLIGLTELSKDLKLDPKTVLRWAKKLNLPRNKSPRSAKIELCCPICNKIFIRTQAYIDHYINNRKVKKFTCSRNCAARKIESDGLAEKAYQYAIQGYNCREISELMNRPMGTISSWLNKKKYRRNLTGESYQSIKNKLKKKDDYKCCKICNFDRIIEIAHIIPASKGGELSEKNTLPLCPNHHYLFDHNKLTPEEFNLIRKKVENAKK